MIDILKRLQACIEQQHIDQHKCNLHYTVSNNFSSWGRKRVAVM